MADKKKVSKRVAAIEASEINGYFNTKKEMIYKSIIWDLLNKSHNEKTKTRKQEKTKKDDKRKRLAARTNHDEEDDNENKKKRRLSSKVNYDVLEKLMNDKKITPEPEKIDRECKEKDVEKEISFEVEEVENEEDEEVDYGNIYYGDEDEEDFNNYDEDYEDY